MRRPVHLLAASLLGLAACSRLPVPFTAAQLEDYSARRRPGPVLVHYLAQADADPSVCDPHHAAGHLARLDEGAMDDLVDALEGGKVAPAAFERCALLLCPEAEDRVAARLLAAVAQAVEGSLRDVDGDDEVANRVEALHHFLALRPPSDVRDSPAGPVLARLLERIAAARAKKQLGPRARQLGAAIVETVEMDLGLLRGARVDAALLASLSDEPLLARLSTRLPTAALRDEARRRRIRLHVLATPFPDVRERAAQVEAAVMELGRNPVAPQGASLARAWIEPVTLERGVLVRQDLLRQRTSLLSHRGDDPGQSVLPTLDLKGLLRFEVTGFAWPITLCSPAADLAVEPCLDARSLEVGNPVARLDEDGVVHFVDDVPLATAVELARSGAGFALRPTYERKVLTSVELPLWFERPRDLVLQGRGAGGKGPDLQLRVEALPERLVVSTRDLDAGRTLLAVLQLRDAREFHVVSRGGQGAAGTTGSRGTDGAQGNAGMPASCPSSPATTGSNGTPGGNGGNGGPGGMGGDGGSVVVELLCEKARCPALEPLVAAMVLSEGGAGGQGGQGGVGGQGGAGGQGGSGTSCYQDGRSSYLGSGMSGMRGANGTNGSNGAAGSRGNPGKVSVRVVAR